MSSTRPTSRPSIIGRLPSVVSGLVLCVAGVSAHAQFVPMPTHVLRSVGGSEYSFTRVSLRQSGLGLSLGGGQGLWPHWEGRVGVMMDRPTNPLKDTYVLFQPVPNGLNIRSMHMLSDYYIDGGFRATAGMVRGDAVQSWWDGGGEGLNISLQRLDSLNIPGSSNGVGLGNLNSSSAPYIGAGYSTRINAAEVASAWRFNADLGLLSINNNNFDRISRTLTGDQSVNSLIRELRFRPLVKFSVGYSF
ncbi:MAG: hypothetical protein KGN37_02145 [Burkholderiales bacterium]|nr:hypothetical protein [Burkholderiales bacterium]MDE2431634.1 hypothetical protein [Burkholderiales bacterium]